MDIPNIFLDTTLTYKDPFFKSNFNRILLKLAEYHKFPIFMSKVVYDETRNKFEENVKLKIQKLDSALEELDVYHPTELNVATIKSTKEDFYSKFDEFYQDLITRGILEIIDLDNSLLPILVDRSIKRIKPFGNKKQEFRDAITWLTYATKAEKENLSNCYFITENINDFCQGKGNIHPDLLEDSKKFQHYVSVKEMLEKESVLVPLIRTIDLVKWVESENIDEDYVLEILNPQFDNIFNEINHFVFNTEIGNFVEDAYEEGYSELWDMDIIEVEETSIEVIGDEIIITGVAKVNANLEFYFYNPLRDSRHDDYIHVGGDGVELNLDFTFSYNTNREVQHFEVNKINVNNTVNLGIYE
ncbi:PIN domain-containing protein [Lysinibacillus sp. NPDC097162]|uniref:PIN domain-containing protein n=1 Tax=Lysinibacillus sp. NPDC097162 TaxID=3364140 RepID=UPI00380C16DE